MYIHEEVVVNSALQQIIGVRLYAYGISVIAVNVYKYICGAMLLQKNFDSNLVTIYEISNIYTYICMYICICNALCMLHSFQCEKFEISKIAGVTVYYRL